MWQSQVAIEHYFVMCFDHTAAFKVLQHRTSCYQLPMCKHFHHTVTSTKLCYNILMTNKNVRIVLYYQMLLCIIYTLLHELACNIASYCTSGRGIFTSHRRVTMQPMSVIITTCMLTSVIKCLLSIPEQRLVSSHTKYQVTRRSNASILIEAHCGCQDTAQPRGPCNNTRAVQYRVILHGTGIGKYCCRNIYWIISCIIKCIMLL